MRTFLLIGFLAGVTLPGCATTHTNAQHLGTTGETKFETKSSMSGSSTEYTNTSDTSQYAHCVRSRGAERLEEAKGECAYLLRPRHCRTLYQYGYPMLYCPD